LKTFQVSLGAYAGALERLVDLVEKGKGAPRPPESVMAHDLQHARRLIAILKDPESKAAIEDTLASFSRFKS
jgi:hypothetical protein